MTVRSFWKLHGLGNDFVFFDAMEQDLELSAQEVTALCDRHTGIGGDGVIVVKPSPRPECAGYMHYINADGTLAQMCGNGVRCFAKFLVDHGYIDLRAAQAGQTAQTEPTTQTAQATQAERTTQTTRTELAAQTESTERAPRTGRFVADTLAGPKPITFTIDDAGQLATATVDMGEPILDPPHIPTTLAANRTNAEGVAYAGEASIDSPWGSFAFTCVSMGNPHAICFLDEDVFAALPAECFTGLSSATTCPNTEGEGAQTNRPAAENASPSALTTERSLNTFDVNRIGAFFESHQVFPEKTNVEFAVVQDRNNIAMRVYERGCAETHACGTGACATQIAAHLLGLTDNEADLHLLGGTLHIALENGHVIMTGPASESFHGTVDPAALITPTERVH